MSWRQEDHDVADGDDEVETTLERGGQHVGVLDLEVGVGRPALGDQGGVGLDRDDVVPARHQGGRDPAHAGPDVEDPGAAGHERVGQPGLAVDVGALRDEPAELLAVPAVALAGQLPPGAGEAHAVPCAGSGAASCSERARRRRRTYSSPHRPSPKPARQVHSHQVRPVSARVP